ncbi:hypothetical protein Dimus_021481 [Dionaea muscipula]
MDEDEFQRLLNLFPIVRSRNYKAGTESSSQPSSQSPDVELKESQDASDQGDKKETETPTPTPGDAFWGNLKSTAENKVGAADADKFCNAFQEVYEKLLEEAVRQQIPRNSS